jgi:hypothetical protein
MHVKGRNQCRDLRDGSRLTVKELSSKLDTTVRLGKTFYTWAAGRFLLLTLLIIKRARKAWKWLDKPHTIRIRKKTIIIGALVLFVAYQFLTPKPERIVYAGADKGPVSPLIVKIPSKKATLPQTHLEPVQTVEPVQVAPVSTPAPIAQSSTNNSGGVVPNCGDNAYANYIYMHESGCSTTITNSGGCLGIGQACPGSKLYAVCPNLDYACENAFFTAYSAKYGGWAGSYAFWVANHWW